LEGAYAWSYMNNQIDPSMRQVIIVESYVKLDLLSKFVRHALICSSVSPRSNVRLTMIFSPVTSLSKISSVETVSMHWCVWIGDDLRRFLLYS
jgi:hypothetical protein